MSLGLLIGIASAILAAFVVLIVVLFWWGRMRASTGHEKAKMSISALSVPF
jgi:hypothetical protein